MRQLCYNRSRRPLPPAEVAVAASLSVTESSQTNSLRYQDYLLLLRIKWILARNLRFRFLGTPLINETTPRLARLVPYLGLDLAVH